ncbi:phosphoribosylanthranilate isomerase [Halobium salinum]|uniref:N-(5'-phosphoribosyl)anthranilate isomerase n=1 Tax=Halobium salinum TaxID=1364940 RepID=A0ABD5P8K5_9EURY|nr:phosphoribosylanthranilate isomerase [Halobium salinum]
MVGVKVCGVTRAADLRAVADAGADAVGVIADVSVDTPREVDPSEAASLVASAPPFLTTTLVTMPDSPERAVELAEIVQPDVLQLHADFDPDEFRFVRAETRSRLVAVVPSDEPNRALDLEGAVDAVLVDSVSEDGAGGTGRTHDWERTRELAASLPMPLILAGGLDPDNVADAVEAVGPYAVDVASGVEASGGVKDHDAVRAFVRSAKRAGEAVREDTDSEVAL